MLWVSQDSVRGPILLTLKSEVKANNEKSYQTHGYRFTLEQTNGVRLEWVSFLKIYAHRRFMENFMPATWYAREARTLVLEIPMSLGIQTWSPSRGGACYVRLGLWDSRYYLFMNLRILILTLLCVPLMLYIYTYMLVLYSLD